MKNQRTPVKSKEKSIIEDAWSVETGNTIKSTNKNFQSMGERHAFV